MKTESEQVQRLRAIRPIITDLIRAQKRCEGTEGTIHDSDSGRVHRMSLGRRDEVVQSLCDQINGFIQEVARK